MKKTPFRKWAVAGVSVILPVILCTAGVLTQRESQALPEFSRRYGVTCQTCHDVPPRLNAFGRAFQANHFNWPSGPPPAYHTGLNALPISGLATLSSERDLSAGESSRDFRTLELFASGGFRAAPQRQGGYFFDEFAAVKGDRAGGLEDGYVALPVAGRRGQYALTVGQFSPMLFQYNPVNSLSQSLPVGLAGGADDFSFTDTVPGVRLDYFDHQGMGTANGNYLAVGVPFAGQLSFNKESRLYGPHGVFAHVFRRWGEDSLGVFGYEHLGNYVTGVLATQALRPNFSLLEAADTGRDEFGTVGNLSLQAEYTLTPQFALTGRLEAVDGPQKDLYPVVAATFYPFGQMAFRLTAETTQGKGNRAASLFAFVQF